MDRLPPYDKTAEQCVLGSMIRDNECIPDILGILEASDFYFDHHQKIAQAIFDEHQQSRPVDLVILATALNARKQLDEIGRAKYLADLWDAAPTSANAEYYARIVLDKAAARRLISTGTEIVRVAFEDSQSAEDLLAYAEKEILNITESHSTSDPITLQQAMSESMQRLDARKKGEVTGIPTGYPELDHILCGFQKQELIIIGARPSVGKTSLVINLLRNICRDGWSALFLSLEQAKIDIADRFAVLHAEIDSWRYRRGSLNAEQIQKVLEAADQFTKWKLNIDDRRGQNITRLAATIRRQHRKRKLDIVFLDYLQYIDVDHDMRRINRHEQIGHFTKRLRNVAGDLDIPVVALAQLRRGDDEKEPTLSSLRESGDIEQDADTVILLHKKPRDQDTDNSPCDIVQGIIAKNRNGPQGEVGFAFRKSIMRFEPLARE